MSRGSQSSYTIPEPGVQDWGLGPAPDLIAHLQEQMSSFGMVSLRFCSSIYWPSANIDEYLPPATKTWCKDQVKTLGHSTGTINSGEAVPGGERVHCHVYEQLRIIICCHIESGQEPILRDSEKPGGAWYWQQETLPSNIPEMDIYNEGPDMTAE